MRKFLKIVIIYAIHPKFNVRQTNVIQKYLDMKKFVEIWWFEGNKSCRNISENNISRIYCYIRKVGITKCEIKVCVSPLEHHSLLDFPSWLPSL